VLKPTADDVFIGSPPLAFTFGLGGLVLFPMSVGATPVMRDFPGQPDSELSTKRCLERLVIAGTPARVADRILRFGRGGQAAVGFGGFVAEADEGVARKPRQALERYEHLLRAAFEQAPAAEAEEGVAAEQPAAAMEGDVGEGMAGDLHHFQVQPERFHPEAIAFADPMRGVADAIVVRGVAGYVEALEQRADAADMVRMVVGQQDRHRPEAAFDCREHRRRVARIDYQGFAGIVGERADVVVAEGWQGAQ